MKQAKNEATNHKNANLSNKLTWIGQVVCVKNESKIGKQNVNHWILLMGFHWKLFNWKISSEALRIRITSTRLVLLAIPTEIGESRFVGWIASKNTLVLIEHDHIPRICSEEICAYLKYETPKLKKNKFIIIVALVFCFIVLLSLSLSSGYLHTCNISHIRI